MPERDGICTNRLLDDRPSYPHRTQCVWLPGAGVFQVGRRPWRLLEDLLEAGRVLGWLLASRGLRAGGGLGVLNIVYPRRLTGFYNFFFSVVPLVRRVLFLLEGLLEALLEPF